LEFFLDAVSFNLNDEFGEDSIYLCSPIITSFGYNKLKEIKLIDYERIFTGKQLKEKFSNRKCKSDVDCVYNEQCGMTCHQSTCTHYSSIPQIVNYCVFLRNYFTNSNSIATEFESLLNECLEIKTLKPISDEIIFGKNEMPLNFNKHNLFKSRATYWELANNYTRITSELRHFLWEQIKFYSEKTTKKHYRHKRQ